MSYINMAEGSMSKLNITPKKYVRENKYFCFLCGINLPDAKRRARITCSVAKLLSDILECELDTIDVTGYLCNDDCYKKTNRFAALRTSLAELSATLKDRQSHAACKTSMRFKRGVPSDVKETLQPAQRRKSLNSVLSQTFQDIAPSSTCERFKSKSNTVQRMNYQKTALNSTSVYVPSAFNTLNYSNLPPFQGCSILMPRPSNILHTALLPHGVPTPDGTENVVCKVEVGLLRTHAKVFT